MAPTLLYFCGLAAAIYVNTCLVVAVVRWFHMCRPYDRKPSYYYPGRPYVAGVWLSSLTLIPYVLHPGSADAWFLARLYFLPVTIFHFTLILFSYFGIVMQWKKWRLPEILAGVPVALALLAAVVLAVWPGEQIGGTRLAGYVLYILGLLITALCFASVAVVYVWASRFDPDDFSNPDDFPVKAARRWLVMVLANVALCWTGALLDSPVVLAVIMLVIAVSCVLFLITALHPNRSRPLEEPPAKEETPTGQVYHRTISKKKQAEMLSAIRMVVEKREGFLDPHLTLQDVADSCGYSRTYISGVVKSELGGFATYVNRLRLGYVDNYMAKHPEATLGEAIDAAGFGSRSRYYDAKSKSLQTL